MRVAVVSNWDERCGNGEYARNLRNQLAKRFETVDDWAACPEGGYDAVIINWHPPVLGFTLEQVNRLRSQGTKIILIVQESNPYYRIDAHSTFCMVDAVVAHEPMRIEGAPVNFRFIHHGAPEVMRPLVGPEVYPIVGTAGFAFRAKRMDIAIRAAIAINGRALILSPSHPQFDPRPMWEEWKALGVTKFFMDEKWAPDTHVALQLSQCTMNVYYAEEGDAPGQSGSARLIASAGRPMIIRRCRKTSALEAYGDELYFVSSEHDVYATARHISSEIEKGHAVKMPRRLLVDIGWSTVGAQFADLVEELVGEAATK